MLCLHKSICIILMGECKKNVTPLLTQRSYVFLALTHLFVLWCCVPSCRYPSFVSLFRYPSFVSSCRYLSFVSSGTYPSFFKQDEQYALESWMDLSLTLIVQSRWMNYVPRKMLDVRSRYARFTIAPIYVRMLRYMDECYGLFTTKNNHFHMDRQKLRRMVTNRVALRVLLFVTIFHYSLENMSKFLWFYDA